MGGDICGWKASWSNAAEPSDESDEDSLGACWDFDDGRDNGLLQLRLFWAELRGRLGLLWSFFLHRTTITGAKEEEDQKCRETYSADLPQPFE